jgi:soluble lytic murein transglycosylase
MFNPLKNSEINILVKKFLAFGLSQLFTIFLCVLCLPVQALALTDQALFQHARESYAAKNEIALAEDVNQLKVQQYLLAPYADYWLMLLKLEQARDEEVQNFLAQYADMPFADRMRGEWLKKLAKQQNWAAFFDEYSYFRREDTALQCYALLGHMQLADIDVSADAKNLWFTTADLPSNCSQLFDLMQKTGVLSTDDIWARLRLALQEGKLNLAKNIASRLTDFDEKNLKLLDVAYQTPQAILENKVSVIKSGRKKSNGAIAISFKTRDGAEINLYALDRLARTNIENAIVTFERLQNNFSIENRTFGWGRIAYHAARSHHPNALKYYTLAKELALDKEQLAWQVRAALRVQNWDVVKSAISSMQPKQAEEGAWRYWKARALKAMNLQVEANAIFGPLSKERHYYGWLAAEELESIMGNPQEQHITTEVEVTAIASQPAIKRALELQRLDMRWEAKAEWVWATRGFDDKQLLAAAEYAARQNWYDIAISTADNTRQIHDFNLRYPTPYRDLIRVSANLQNLDEAWVYGLTRQESRFMHFAKSGVGASGLMQVMPATAKWAAKRMGLDDYSHDKIHDLPTNIGIGTYYMRYTLELMGGQAVVATAAYNAGPSRAKRWLASEPLEAAIYIESIPFSETRNYVQKVMANAQMYAPRLGTTIQSLKSRLGVVPGSGKPEAVLADSE